jgi:hypothetical protein
LLFQSETDKPVDVMATGCHAPTNPCHNRFGRISRGLVLIAAGIAIEIIPTGAGTISSGCDQLSREELAPKAHLHIARGNSEESIGSRLTRTIAGEHELDASQGPAAFYSRQLHGNLDAVAQRRWLSAGCIDKA